MAILPWVLHASPMAVRWMGRQYGPASRRGDAEWNGGEGGGPTQGPVGSVSMDQMGIASRSLCQEVSSGRSYGAAVVRDRRDCSSGPRYGVRVTIIDIGSVSVFTSTLDNQVYLYDYNAEHDLWADRIGGWPHTGENGVDLG